MRKTYTKIGVIIMAMFFLNSIIISTGFADEKTSFGNKPVIRSSTQEPIPYESDILPKPETADIVFQMEWQHTSKPGFLSTKNKIPFLEHALLPDSAMTDMDDCVYIYSVRAVVSDGSTDIAWGGPYACSANSGIIKKVPVGTSRIIQIYGLDMNGDATYGGSSTMNISAGAFNNAGKIICARIANIWYKDTDGDKYSDGNYMVTVKQPDGYYLSSDLYSISEDCDDSNSGVNPMADEICGDTIDQDCNDSDIACVSETDTDGDGVYDAQDQCPNDPNKSVPGICGCGKAESECSGKFTNALGMTFVLIPGGTFSMGSPEDEPARDADENQHQVTLTQSFYLQTTEVTQGQWRAVMRSNPSYFSNCGNNCPVETVSWNDVQSFIAVMNRRGEGTYGLPTEAEWEYAARAGSNSAFYNGGITYIDDCAPVDPNLNLIGWYCGNSHDKTHPVAQKQPNAWGLYDMIGNVWEWCADWYGTYPSKSVTDPTGPSSGPNHVVRGGGWYYSAQRCRSANRYMRSPGDRNVNYGFRLVKMP